MGLIITVARSVNALFQIFTVYRTTIEALVQRDIHGRYVTSATGLPWAIVQPIAFLPLYTFAFAYALNIRFEADGVTGRSTLCLFCGMPPWLAFAEGIRRSASVIVGAGAAHPEGGLPVGALVGVRLPRTTYRTQRLLGGLIFLVIVSSSFATEAATVPGDFSTIQAAINAVVNGTLADGTVIDIQPGTYSEALLINATPRSMTLRAAGGPGTAVVDAAGKGTSAVRILSATGTIRVDGLRFRNGQGDPTGGTGGGFTFDGASPTVVNCTVENNSSLANGGAGTITRSNAAFQNCVFQNNTARQFGGGLLIGIGSRPTFTNCTIQGNISGAASNIGSGGGVHVNDASPTFLSSRIVNNQAKFAGGGIFAIAAFGSANGEATVTLEDSVVSGNSVAAGQGGIAEAGGVHVEDFTVGIVRRTAVKSNSAITAGGLGSFRARFVIEDSIIEFNTAAGGFGGGINGNSNNVTPPLQRAASIVLANSVVRNNTATLGGGISIGGDVLCGGTCASNTGATKATLQITDSLVDSNTVNGTGGGGIFVARTTLTITKSLVSRNHANGNGWGGGLMVTDATVATLTNVRIAANAAEKLGGGAFVDINVTVSASTLVFHDNTAPAAGGGGIFVGSQANSGTVLNTVFVDNTGTDIVEQCPPASSAPFLTYTNTKFGTTGTVYNSICPPPGALNLAAFGALPKASGSGTIGMGDVQADTLFMAAPPASPSVLAWSVIRASRVAITPGVGTFSTSPQTGTADVTVSTNTTYTLSATTPLGMLIPPLMASVLGLPVRFGAPGDVPVQADYDGDGKADFAVYRPATAEWFIFGSATGFRTLVFGAPAGSGLGDTPVPADFDGDGKADVAIYRKATGEWFIFGSATGFRTVVFGAPAASGLGDIPVPADYDGDGKADLAVRRSANSTWFIFRSRLGFLQQTWGAPTDLPTPGDFDGNGKADIAVWRPGDGAWLIAP